MRHANVTFREEKKGREYRCCSAPVVLPGAKRQLRHNDAVVQGEHWVRERANGRRKEDRKHGAKLTGLIEGWNNLKFSNYGNIVLCIIDYYPRVL